MINSVFQENTTEQQELMADLLEEVIQARGNDFIYIPRSVESKDVVWEENILESFTDTHTIEMYMENANEFSGQGDMMSKFAFMIDDEADLVCSKRRFLEVTGVEYPSEGDLIYWDVPNALFEIVDVQGEAVFYKFDKTYSFSIKIRQFRYSNEDFDTGINYIDDVENVQTGGTTLSQELFDHDDELDTEVVEENIITDDVFGSWGDK